MKKIVIIVGKTGAGKSTLCRKIADTSQFKLLSFAKAGKEFARSKGYEHIRECYHDLGKEIFAKDFTEFFSQIINDKINSFSNVVIDGLYVESIALRLKEHYSVLIIDIDVPLEICLQRIFNRENNGFIDVKKEYSSKEELKTHLGSNAIIELADIVIDGTDDSDTVYNSVQRCISNFLGK